MLLLSKNQEEIFGALARGGAQKGKVDVPIYASCEEGKGIAPSAMSPYVEVF